MLDDSGREVNWKCNGVVSKGNVVLWFYGFHVLVLIKLALITVILVGFLFSVNSGRVVKDRLVLFGLLATSHPEQ